MKFRIFLVFIISSYSLVFGTIINIPTDQPTIQEGINVSVSGDTVLVQPGIYLENIDFNGKSITLCSLFFTTQDTTYITQTIIDGNEDDSVVYFGNGEDFSSMLIGFTIQNGYNRRGGGIYCDSTNPSIISVIITNNTAQRQGYPSYGGGVFCSSSSPYLENVTISNNSANSGSGIYTTGNGGGISCLGNSNPTLQFVTIIDNYAHYSGGGIHCHGSNINLENVTVSNNVADFGGGIYCNDSDINLEYITIANNSADTGGGIYSVNSEPSFSNVIISNNSTNGNGGGIFGIGSNAVLESVTISNNSAYSSGGGIYYNDSESILNNVIVSNNTSENNGAGIYCSSSDINLEGVTISENSSNLHGGGIYCDESNIDFSNTNLCNIYSNMAIANRGIGVDIYSVSCPIINVIVDTFTIMNPTDYYASPIDNFTFDILNGLENNLINADVYVAVDGDNSNSGTSPENPFKTIRYALSKIYSDSLNINTIHIAEGTYSTSTNGEHFPLIWSSYVNLSGDTVSETILDAESTSNVFKFQDVDSVLVNNLTITGGISENGAGIYCGNSNLSLENISIFNNSANGNGGALYSSNSYICLTNSAISNNTANSQGGGIYCNESITYLDSITISNNSANSGGGIYNTYSEVNLFNIIIASNTATKGGGMYFENTVSSSNNISITDNSANYNGGGIYCSDSDIILECNTISSNSSNGAGGGSIAMIHLHH